jgi:hypothetical protein
LRHFNSHQGFIRRALELASQMSTVQTAERAKALALGATGAGRMAVDLEYRLKQLTLQGLSSDCLPSASAVEWLRTQIGQYQAKGVQNPFILCDLVRFLPDIYRDERGACVPFEETTTDPFTDWFRGIAAAATAAAGKGPPLPADPSQQKRLSILTWTIAYDRFALACAALGMMSYAAALAHKENCLQVALSATYKGRTTALGLVYDEICRREWSEQSLRDSNFKVNTVAVALNATCLHKAETTYDSRSKKGKGKSDTTKGDAKSGHKGRKGRKGKGQDNNDGNDGQHNNHAVGHDDPNSEGANKRRRR